MAWLLRILDGIGWAWVALIAGMAITGGGRIWFAQGTLELSQLFAWVAGLALLTGLRQLVARRLPSIDRVSSPLGRSVLWLRDRMLAMHAPDRWVVAALGALSLLFALIHSARHWSFRTSIMDLGVIHHVLWRSWKGFLGEDALLACDTCPNGTFLADHLAFTLPFAAPMAGIFRSHEAIFVLQSVLMAASVYTLLSLGPLRASRERWALGLLLLVCHPALRNAWVWDFREDHLGFLFFTIASIAAYRRRMAVLAVSSALALLTKENLAFVLPWLYLATWLRHSRGVGGSDPELAERRSLGPALLALNGLCAFWAWVSFRWLLPAFAGASGGGTHEVVARLPGLGGSPGEVLSHLITHPWLAATLIGGRVLTKTGLHYLVLLLGPWLFLGWRARIWLLPAIPGVLMNLLSGAETQRSLQFHYELIILPFLALAMLEGARKADARKLAGALFLAILFSGRWPGLALRENWPSAADWARLSWVRKEIPEEGVLAASDHAFAQVSLRSELRYLSFPDGERFNRAASGASAETPWRALWEMNAVDRTGLSGHSLREAQWILLDTARPAEAALARRIPEGWKERSRSPDGRFVLWGKEQGANPRIEK